MGVGDADKMDIAVNVARKQGNTSALIHALENKVKQLVSPFFHDVVRDIDVFIGINARLIVNVSALPNLLGSVH